MIGIILWVIVIFIIMCYAAPGFFTLFLILIPVLFIYFYICDEAPIWYQEWRNKRWKKKGYHPKNVIETHFSKRKNLCEWGFIDLISKVKKAKGIKGEYYTEIEMYDEIVTGRNNSIGKYFDINVYYLYSAYEELEHINSTNIKAYVGKDNYAAMAILIEAGILVFNEKPVY